MLPRKNQEPVKFRELEPVAYPLVNRFYKANSHKGKARGGERVLILEQSQKIVAALRACPEANGYLLRSVWVDRNCRGQGLGTALLKHSAKALSPASCWCFPYSHLKNFYLCAGFLEILPEEIPLSLASKYLSYTRKMPGLLLMSHNNQPA